MTVPSGASYSTPPRQAGPDPERMLRILFALNSFQQVGPGNLMFQVCERLLALPGLHLEVVALSRGGELLAPYREMGVPATIVPSRGRGGLRRLRSWAREVAQRRTRPHVVHTNLLWPDLAMRLVLGDLGAPRLSTTIHGLHAVGEKGALAGVAYRVLDRLTRGRCDAFVAISNHVRETMLRAGYPESRTRVIPNGVDALQIFPASPETRAEIRHLLAIVGPGPMVVAAGNLIDIKNPFVSLEAFARVHERHPDATLVFVGEGPLRDSLETEASARRLPVRFIGHLSRMLPRVLASADVVFHPSRTEGFGLIVAEAMAAGAPVVAGATGGIRELITEGATGRLVDPQDAAALANAALDLLADPEAARAMGAAAREHVSLNYEIGRTADAYLALWRELAPDAAAYAPGPAAAGESPA